MHVIQVTPRYVPNIGGVETVVQKISENLVSDNAKVTVYSVDLTEDLLSLEKIRGVLVKRFTPIVGDPLYLPEPRFMTSLRREKADVIHVHNIHILTPLLVTLFKQKRQKLVLQPHYHRFGQSPFRHSLLKAYKRIVNDLVLPYTDIVIANSDYERKILEEDFSRCKNVVLIPEGVDVAEAKRVKHESTKLRRILYVGSLTGYKNVDKIIEGFALLTKKTDQDFKLVIVGKGPQLSSLVNIAKRLGVASQVEWMHDLTRDQLLSEYAKASVFILLSHLESFSRSVYDALLTKVPVVALNFGAMEHLVRAGFVEGVNTLNPKDIADAMSKAGMRHVQDASAIPDAFLDWQDYFGKIVTIYDRLVEN